MATIVDSNTATPAAGTPPARIASVDVFSDLAAIEPLWRALEASSAVMTPYQRYDFLSLWQQHVGAAIGLRPCIAVARDAQQQPRLLLPLGVGEVKGIRIARFLGGKHATFNMPIWHRDTIGTIDRAELRMVLQALRVAPHAVDALALAQQPRRWQGHANPMAQLPAQDSVNACPLLTIPSDATPASLISNSFRRRLKSKERKLQSLPGYRYLRADSTAEIAQLLNAFFIVKPQRMALQKLPNVFAEAGVEAFIRAACQTRLADGGHAIDIHALVCDAEMIAMFAGVADGSRFSMMFNTYTLSENARYSPGLILMRSIVDHYAALGYTSLDLGIGSDDYKLLFCKSDEPLFDSFIGLSTRGTAVARSMSVLDHLKRTVKRTPLLMTAVQAARGLVHR